MESREIRKVLRQMEVIPSKKMGQNFLCDAHVARSIVDCLNPHEEDVVVECGPGTGALTEHLVGRVKKVILIEFDGRLAEYLKKKFEDEADVEVHHADGAKFDTRELFKYGQIKFLGNLPYSSGGVIMRNFMKRPSIVKRSVLMLQKEFIDRVVAKPKTKDYGVLTLRMQSEWESEKVMLVPPEAFYPIPKVDSTVMVCIPKELSSVEAYDARLFDELARRGFAQRRKQVKKQMPESPSWNEVIKEVGISATSRAEELSLEQWQQLARIYDENPLSKTAQKEDEEFEVVDEMNKVIGLKPRKVVHEFELKHRAVHVFVFNKKKELLLQKRSHLKDVCPGLWGSSVAGHLEVGESYEQCAKRELKEEMGISLDEVKKVGEISPSSQNGQEFVELYVALYDGALRYPCSEVESAVWFSMDQIDRWLFKRSQDFSGGFLDCLALFQKKVSKKKEE